MAVVEPHQIVGRKILGNIPAHRTVLVQRVVIAVKVGNKVAARRHLPGLRRRLRHANDRKPQLYLGGIGGWQRLGGNDVACQRHAVFLNRKAVVGISHQPQYR